jgi:peptide/nickel transport system substrate-binding protein
MRIQNIKKLSRTGIRLSALLSLLLIINGCGKNNKDLSENTIDTTVVRVDTSGAVEGDWLIVHLVADAEGMNPITTNDASASEIQGYMYETLNNLDPVTFELIPYLAQLPEISSDHLSYTYQLKKNVAFSDGKPLTGEDVIFSMKCIKDPYVDDAALRNYYESVKRIDLVNGDPYKVKITMSKPYWRAIYSNSSFPIVPKHILDPQNQSDKFTWDELTDFKSASKNPNIQKFADFLNSQEVSRDPKYVIGSGPYIMDSWRTGQEVTLHRNQNYWDRANTPAYVNKVVFRTIQDNSAALVAAKNNEIDEMYVIVPSDYYNNIKDPIEYHLRKAQPSEPGYGYIAWNENSPLFSDKRVRLALSYMVDRKELIARIMYNDAVPIQSPVFYKQTKFLEDLPYIPYDPEKAKQLLSEAGWKDSDGDGVLDKIIDGKKVDFNFTFLIYPSPVRKQILLVVIDALKKVGINAGLQELEWTVYLDKLKRHEFDATMGAWTSSVLPPDPYQIWHSSQAQGEGSNFISFKNAVSDSLIEQYRNEFDENKRIEILKEWQKVIYDQQPYTFLWSGKARYIFNVRFKNTRWYNKQPSPNFNEWWVPKDLQKYTQSPAD